MSRLVTATDLNILKRFSRSFTADCTRCPQLRFSDPVYATYNLEFLHRLGDMVGYTPLPPTRGIIDAAARAQDWVAIFKHCDITNLVLRDLCTMSGLLPETVSAIVSEYQPLTTEFIRSNYECIDWKCVSVNGRISVHVLLEYSNRVDWVSVSRQNRTVDELLVVEHLVDWDVVVDTRDVFDARFVRTFQWTINFDKLSSKTLSAETIVEFADSLNMALVSQSVPADCIRFIDTVKDVVDWKVLVESHKMFTYEFVTAFYRYIDFDLLSSKYLDIETLDHFANVLNWTKIHRSRKYAPCIKKQFASRMWWDKLLQL